MVEICTVVASVCTLEAYWGLLNMLQLEKSKSVVFETLGIFYLTNLSVSSGSLKKKKALGMPFSGRGGGSPPVHLSKIEVLLKSQTQNNTQTYLKVLIKNSKEFGNS